MNPAALRPVCTILSVLIMAAGGLGMSLSFLSMACAELPDIVAGGAGFIAGSVMLGAGLHSLSMLATRTDPHEIRPQTFDAR